MVRVAKGVLFRLVAVVIGILIAAGIAEGALRLFRPQRTGPSQLTYDARLGSIPIPNQRGRITLPGVYSYSFSHDAQGRRITTGGSYTRAGTTVLLFGDSFTYGVGVSDDETFASRLQGLFDRAGRPFRVVNVGNPGKGTDYALRYAETMGTAARPTVMVLCFYRNDFRDNERGRVYRVAEDGSLTLRVSVGKVYVRKAGITQNEIYDWLISRSHLANVFRNLAIRYGRWNQRPEEDEDTGAFSPGRTAAGSATGQRAYITGVLLQHLARLAEATKIAVDVVYCPAADEVEYYRRSGQISRDERELRRVLPPGVEFLSLTPALAAAPVGLEALYFDEERIGHPTWRPVIPGHGHWTPLAHDIVAKHLARFLQPALRFPDPVVSK